MWCQLVWNVIQSPFSALCIVSIQFAGKFSSGNDQYDEDYFDYYEYITNYEYTGNDISDSMHWVKISKIFFRNA